LGSALRSAPIAVGAVALGASAFSGYHALRVTSWAVMTDELQVVRLAESIGTRLSPVPSIHGVYYGALSQLYPLLIAPFFGLMTAPTAARGAHLLNAVLLPSAAWPAFLLARSVTRSHAAAVTAGTLTAVTPWLVLTSTLLTENVAYPVFVWAVFLCHRTLAAPSARRDAAALAGLVLAFFARTQFLVVAAVLPLAVIVHELGFAMSAAGGKRADRVRQALRRIPVVHPVLAAAYGLALLGAAVLTTIRSLTAIVGNYSVSFRSDLLPAGVWSSSVAHLDQVVVGCSVAPFLLASAWVASALIRPDGKQAHAFAVLFALLVPLLTLEVASFDLRFTPRGFVQDRYLFYLAPLFAVGAAAALTQRTSFRLRSVLLTVAAALCFVLLQYSDYRDDTIIFWAAPAAAFHPALAHAADALGSTPETLIPIAAAVVSSALLVLSSHRPRAAVLAAGVVLAGLGAGQAAYVFARFADPSMSRPTLLGLDRDWIDKAVPNGSSVALLPSAHDAPGYWWEAEFWNKRVDRVLRVNGGPTFSPFPADDVRVQYDDGALRGPQPSDFLVVSPSETRFHVRAMARIVDTKALELVRVRPPYLLDWATNGVSPDGWTLAGRLATLRFYGHGNGGRRTIVLVLSSSSRAALPLGYTLRAATLVQSGSVDPGGARPPVRFGLCVPAHGFVDVRLRVHGSVRIPDGRLVGLHIDALRIHGTAPCEASS
jgi:hypothetical protein